MGPTLKFKFLKSIFLHARRDQKIGPEPIFMSLGPQISDISVNNRKGAHFLTLDHMGPPLKNQNFENIFFACLRGPKIRTSAKFS